MGYAQSVLSSTKNDFMLMAIAGRKWMTEKAAIDRVIREIGWREGNLKFLLLNPNSIWAKKLSVAQNLNEDHVAKQILDTLKELAAYNDQNLHIEVKLYNFMPIFRIAIVDNYMMYLGFYKSNSSGESAHQLILRPTKDRSSLYKSLMEYFDIVWHDDKTIRVDLSEVNDKIYISSLR